MYHILLLRDCAEIIFYSSILYVFCIWLKTDKTKNIVGYFLTYCITALSCWYLQMPTMTHFLFSYAPIALLLFIIMHEKTLQKNLVALRTITPATAPQDDWLDTVLSSCLTIINANKSVTVVIEHQNSLENFITTPFFINADIGKGILDLLLASTSYDDAKMIWINTTGRLRGINASWHVHAETQQIHFINKQDALFYTLQTDAIVFNLNPITRTFSLIIDGKETSNISAHNARALIKKQLLQQTTKKKGAYRENNTQQNTPAEKSPSA